MLVELGPVEGEQVRSWIKFARRVTCELRLDPSDLQGIATEDIMTSWANLIDEWAAQAEKSTIFRWSATFEAEQAEYLLHGFERCIGSDVVRQTSTSEELQEHQRFSMQIVQAFVDGFSGEGGSCQQYVDQVRTSVGALLDH